MTTDGIDHQLTLEVIQQLDQQGLLSDTESINKQLVAEPLDFDAKIIKRAQWLAQHNGIHELLHKVTNTLRWLMVSLCLLFVVLGGLGALNAFDQLQNGVANFYWLIIVLLGFNLVALLLWLIAISLPSAGGGSVLGSLLTMLKSLSGRLLFHQHRDYLVLETVFNRLYRGRTGRWNLSRLTHSLWSCYLAGGLVMILLILSTRQYDFAWSTTILGESAFTGLTELMAKLPQSLGLVVPDAQQIAQSRLGMLSGSGDPSLRQAWASLLVAGLCLYGLVPRLLLLTLCQLVYRRSVNKSDADLSQPYYLHLQTLLMPESRQIGVQDDDQQEASARGEIFKSELGNSLPDQAFYCGLEVDPTADWLPKGIASDKNIGLVDSRISQQDLLTWMQNHNGEKLVVVVPVQRSADRGMERFLTELAQLNQSELYLGLRGPSSGSLTEQSNRYADWVQLGRNAGIAADHIVRLQDQGEVV